MKRLEKKFSELKSKSQCAFVAYICAGDPDYATSMEILKSLPEAGCDIIELGVPFLDPSGDGPIIENASKRAITNGASLKNTLMMAAEFRKINASTPIILMGYYNPFLKYGIDKFFTDAEKSGIDGILIVDLPLEERAEITLAAAKTNIDLINLVGPLSSEERIAKIDKVSDGFLYLVSMLGITGTKQANLAANKINLEKIRANSKLPVVIGFGIQQPQQAAEFAKIGADGVVVGSTIVKIIEKNLSEKKSSSEIVTEVLKTVKAFADAIKK